MYQDLKNNLVDALLLDLSMTQSEDDLDVSGIRTRRGRPKRPSLEQTSFSMKKKRKSGNVCDMH